MTHTTLARFVEACRREDLAALATLLTGESAGSHLFLSTTGENVGSLGSPEIDAAALPLMQEALARSQPRRVTLDLDAASHELFVEVSVVRNRLIVVGAVHIAGYVVTFANLLGFRTVVVDNRTAFATLDRFGHAAQLIVRWPADALAELDLRPADSLVFLSHDEKIDYPALAFALSTPARYIGALGSRRTHERRLTSLREIGVSEDALARIHAPIGLDIGASTPEEIALAIMAEIVAERRKIEVAGQP